MADLRSSLLKKRAVAQPPKSDAESDPTSDDPLKNPAKYGKLKMSAAAQQKQTGRKYFDSADQKTVGLPSPGQAPANSGAAAHASKKPSGLATTHTAEPTATGAAGSPSASLATLSIGAAGSSGGSAAAGGSDPQASPPNPSRPVHPRLAAIVGGPGGSGGAPGVVDPKGVDAADSRAADAKGPGVGVPAGPSTVNDEGVGTQKVTSPSSQVPSGPGQATGKVHIAAHGKASADVLLVEDVRVSQRIAQVALNKARFKTDVASTAEEAIDKFKTHGPYKIVLMDIQLPKMNGMEATQIIRDFEEALEKQNAADGKAASDSAAASASASATATATAAATHNAPPPEASASPASASAASSGSPASAAPSVIGIGGAVVGNHPRSLIFGLTGAVEEENLRQYRAVGMNGCIAKGKLLVEALKTAIERISEKPSEFVNLVAM